MLVVLADSQCDSPIACADRDGCEWMLSHLNRLQVPLLVFSGGIGDIIEEVFRQQATLHGNIKIISNYMDFNQEVKSALGRPKSVLYVVNCNSAILHEIVINSMLP